VEQKQQKISATKVSKQSSSKQNQKQNQKQELTSFQSRKVIVQIKTKF